MTVDLERVDTKYMRITKKQFQKIEKIGNEYKGIPYLMDKAYEGDKTRNLAGNYGHEPVVPPNKNRSDPWEYDVELYK